MPPARSGIADYSAVLLEQMHEFADIDVISAKPARFDPAAYDAAVYQLGNNGHHDFVYEAALAHPGVVVLHESNLHHLICDLTIRRGDWDSYLREVEFEGGGAALEFGERVRRLEVGPDYDGLPMLRRVLAAAKAVIVHSKVMEDEVRRAGFAGRLGRIPHGAWLPEIGERMTYRHRLGLDEATPLIGAFGFLKPYKRIAEALRAFKRLTRVEPAAKMILVGEPHPDFPVAEIIRSLDLGPHVRMLGFTPLDDFAGYMSACDIVLNLRFPTVNESSGSLLRALGLGKSVIVSNVGSFAEFPDEICLKAPVDSSEEDVLFEYLNLLVTRPSLRRAMGAAARAWVERECDWRSVARRYVDFIKGEEGAVVAPEPVAIAEAAAPPAPPPVEPEYIIGWADNADSKKYIETHITRLAKTLAITPPGGAGDRVLEMGSYLQITPALKTKLGYGEVRGCYYGPLGTVDQRKAKSIDGDEFECGVELFDAEKDVFPYTDEYFSTVLCCELIEHLPGDPMHMMSEINRILKPGGHLVLTTPNISSARAIVAILEGFHPGFFPAYIRPAEPGAEVEARHNREYTPREIAHLFADAGFFVTHLETGEFLEAPRPEQAWVNHLLERYLLTQDLRGDGIYAVGRKDGPVRRRYPAWLYT